MIAGNTTAECRRTPRQQRDLVGLDLLTGPLGDVLPARGRDLLGSVSPQAAVIAGDRPRVGLVAGRRAAAGGRAEPASRLTRRPGSPAVAAEPYRLVLAGDWRAAADAWQALGSPYEQAQVLAHGDNEAGPGGAAAAGRARRRPGRPARTPPAGSRASPRPERDGCRQSGPTDRHQRSCCGCRLPESNADTAATCRCRLSSLQGSPLDEGSHTTRPAVRVLRVVLECT